MKMDQARLKCDITFIRNSLFYNYKVTSEMADRSDQTAYKSGRLTDCPWQDCSECIVWELPASLYHIPSSFPKKKCFQNIYVFIALTFPWFGNN